MSDTHDPEQLRADLAELQAYADKGPSASRAAAGRVTAAVTAMATEVQSYRHGWASVFGSNDSAEQIMAEQRAAASVPLTVDEIVDAMEGDDDPAPLGLPGPSSARCPECDSPHLFGDRCAPSADDPEWGLHRGYGVRRPSDGARVWCYTADQEQSPELAEEVVALLASSRPPEQADPQDYPTTDAVLDSLRLVESGEAHDPEVIKTIASVARMALEGWKRTGAARSSVTGPEAEVLAEGETVGAPGYPPPDMPVGPRSVVPMIHVAKPPGTRVRVVTVPERDEAMTVGDESRCRAAAYQWKLAAHSHAGSPCGELATEQAEAWERIAYLAARIAERTDQYNSCAALPGIPEGAK